MHKEQHPDYVRDVTWLARERTRLANRRTLLAWVRTSLGLMAVGFLLEKVRFFLVSQGHHAISAQEIDMLGKITFLAGPILLAYGGYEFIRLEKLMGHRQGFKHVLPYLFGLICVIAGALFLVFL